MCEKLCQVLVKTGKSVTKTPEIRLVVCKYHDTHGQSVCKTKPGIVSRHVEDNTQQI